jgi:uncharacterized membrane protein
MPFECITCGRNMPDDAAFCPDCGRVVVRQPPNLTSPVARAVEESGDAQSASPQRSSLAPRSPEAPKPPAANEPATPETSSATARPMPSISPRPAPTRSTLPRSPSPQTVRTAGAPSPAAIGRAYVAPPPAVRDRLLAAVAYLTFLPALAFLLLKQYQRRRFVRFHARQSVLFWIVVALIITVGIFAATFGFLLIWMVTGILVALALFLTWCVLSIKALQGAWFKLPALGELAERWT